MEFQGHLLSSLALRFAIAKAQQNSRPSFTVTTITGIGSISDLTQNVATARQVLRRKETGGENSAIQDFIFDQSHTLDGEAVERDAELYEGVKKILGSWLDFDLSATPVTTNALEPRGQASNATVGRSEILHPISRL